VFGELVKLLHDVPVPHSRKRGLCVCFDFEYDRDSSFSHSNPIQAGAVSFRIDSANVHLLC
jgi:hypothetical protein